MRIDDGEAILAMVAVFVPCLVSVVAYSGSVVATRWRDAVGAAALWPVLLAYSPVVFLRWAWVSVRGCPSRDEARAEEACSCIQAEATRLVSLARRECPESDARAAAIKKLASAAAELADLAHFRVPMESSRGAGCNCGLHRPGAF